MNKSKLITVTVAVAMIFAATLALIPMSGDTEVGESDHLGVHGGFIVPVDPGRDVLLLGEGYIPISNVNELNTIVRGDLTGNYFLTNDIVFDGSDNLNGGIDINMNVTFTAGTLKVEIVDTAEGAWTDIKSYRVEFGGNSSSTLSTGIVEFAGVSNTKEVLLVGGLISSGSFVDEPFAYFMEIDTSVFTSETVTFDSNGNFTPIDGPFTGTFDGNGFVIKGMVTAIYNPHTSGTYGGLFNQLGAGAAVRNLGIEAGSSLVSPSSYSMNVGGMIGSVNAGSGQVMIENCYNASDTIGGAGVGGIVSTLSAFNGEVIIRDCHNAGNVKGYTNYSTSAAGIVGSVGLSNWGLLTIENCYNTGDITFNRNAANLAGIVATVNIVSSGGAVTIRDCYNEGNITTATTFYDLRVGGIVGNMTLSAHGGSMAIENCYNTGDLTASGSSSVQIGGIVGAMSAGTSGISTSFTECYNAGDITGTSTSTWSGVRAGGIVGHADASENMTFNDCYNAGDITAASTSSSAYAAGIAGFAGAFDSATFNDCYNAGDITAASTSSSAYAAGIAAFVYVSNDIGYVSFIECYNAGSIQIARSGDISRAAGIVAHVYVIYSGDITFDACYNTGDITGEVSSQVYAAGIAACLWVDDIGDITFTECYNTGDITIIASYGETYVAGIVGHASARGDTTFNDCYNTGDITATSSSIVYVAGIAGDVKNGNTTFNDCYNTGNVLGRSTSNSVYAAGILGNKASYSSSGYVSFTECHNTGSIRVAQASSTSYAAGIAAYVYFFNSGNTTFTECHNTGTITGGVSSTVYAAGIAAYVHISDIGNITFTECHNTANITIIASWSDIFAVGIAAYVYVGSDGDITFTECWNTGDLLCTSSSWSMYAVGIAGYVRTPGIGNITFTECWNAGGMTLFHLSTSSGGYTAGIAGELHINSGFVTVRDCWNAGDMKTDAMYSAGIIGRASINTVDILIEGCYNTGNITSGGSGSGSGAAGIIVSASSWSSSPMSITIQRCYNTGDISASRGGSSMLAGGIAGEVRAMTVVISDCYNTGNITSDTNCSSHIGGIVGDASSLSVSAQTLIKNCYNTGNITSSVYNTNLFLGGIVGMANPSHGSVIVRECYNTGNIAGAGGSTSSSDRLNVGGIVGSAAYGWGSGSGTMTIENVYNAGNISVEKLYGIHVLSLGGIAGFTSIGTDGWISLENAYNTGDIASTGFAWSDMNVGGIFGHISSSSGSAVWASFVNCYYLDGTADNLYGQISASGGSSVALFVDGVDITAAGFDPMIAFAGVRGGTIDFDQWSWWPKTVAEMTPTLSDAQNGDSVFFTGSTTFNPGSGNMTVDGYDFVNVWTIWAHLNNGNPVLDHFVQPFTINGTVICSVDGLPVDGVTVTYTFDVGGGGTATTDINGEYTINVPEGAIVTITMTKTDFRFQNIPPLAYKNGNWDLLTVGTPTFTITVTVLDQDDGDAPMEGVHVEYYLNGVLVHEYLPEHFTDSSGIATITADVGQIIKIRGLNDPSGTHAVVDDLILVPAFTSSSVPLSVTLYMSTDVFTVSGTIKDASGAPLAGVVVHYVVDGVLQAETEPTDATGVYRISAMNGMGHEIVITAVGKEGFMLVSSIPLTVFTADAAGIDFVMTSEFNVTGAVTYHEHPFGGIPGVTITYEIIGGTGGTVITGTGGSYSIPATIGQTVWITNVSLDGYRLIDMGSVPEGPLTFTNSVANFTMTAWFSVSGQVISSASPHNGIQGVTITYVLDDGPPATVTTAADGTYVILYVHVGQEVRITDVSLNGYTLSSVVPADPFTSSSVVNFIMVPQFTVSGEVTTGDPLQGMPGVTITYTVNGMVQPAITTEADGTYVITAHIGQNVLITSVSYDGYTLVSGIPGEPFKMPVEPFTFSSVVNFTMSLDLDLEPGTSSDGGSSIWWILIPLLVLALLMIAGLLVQREEDEGA